MTDSRDTDRELATLVSELEATLTQLHGSLGDWSPPVGQTGRERRREAGWNERSSIPRPPGMREMLRFTEQQTIPTLIAILEANIRLLRLAAAALRAVDPDRSVDGSGGDNVAKRALDAGGKLSADRLTSGLRELQNALSGVEPTDPEARELLEDAEQLSREIRERLSESAGQRGPGGGQFGTGATTRPSGNADDAVRIDVEDVTAGDDGGDTESRVDVDAELDSIRDEVRGDTGDAAGTATSEDEENGGENGESNGGGGENDGEDGENGGGEHEDGDDGGTGGDRVADDE